MGRYFTKMKVKLLQSKRSQYAAPTPLPMELLKRINLSTLALAKKGKETQNANHESKTFQSYVGREASAFSPSFF